MEKSSKEKWHSQLMIFVVGILFFELISGLIIYWGNFSLTTQAFVVIHTAFGLVVIIPYIIYQIRHWLSYRNNNLTQHKLLGYIAMVTAVVTALTGVFLTYQAVYSTRINYVIDKIHIVATFAFLLSVVPHIGLLLIRDYKATKEKKESALVKYEKAFGIKVLYVIGILIAVGVLFIYASNPIEFHNEFPKDLLDTIISRTVRFSESTVKGEPITTYASSSLGAVSYRRLARELIYRGGAK